MATDQSGPNRAEGVGDLSQLKRRAKQLLRSYRSGDPQAVETVGQHFDGADPERFRLAQAQLVLARSLGFPSWAKLRASLDVPGSRKRRPRTIPDRMRDKRYVYDVDIVDGDQAWALFEACSDGDAQAVRSLLDPRPVIITSIPPS